MTEQWIVYTYQTVAEGKLDCHAYGAFDNSADEQAGVPFDQATAESLASNINENTPSSGISAMALPLEQTLQPGV